MIVPRRRYFYKGDVVVMKHPVRIIAIILTVLLIFSLTSCGSNKPSGEEVLSDGVYHIDVTLTGGTGKATIASPAELTVKDGKMTATVIWSSKNYDYMIVDDVKYIAEIIDDHSVFYIPVSALDEELPVIGDTVAMSTPHEISYTLFFDSSTLTDEVS